MKRNIGQLFKLYHDTLLTTACDPGRATKAWKNMSPYLASLKPGIALAKRWNDYIEVRMLSVSVATVNREQQVLMACFNWCVGQGYLSHAPVLRRLASKKKVVQALTEESISALLSAARWDTPLYHFCAIALLTGQRKEAIVDLRWRQVDFAENTIDFNDYEAPLFARMKGRGQFIMPTELRNLLLEIREHHPGGDYVLQKHGRRLGNITRAFAKIVKRAGLPPTITPKVLRSTVATRLIHNDMPLLKVSKVLGHASISTTERHYVRFSPHFIGNDADKLNIGIR